MQGTGKTPKGYATQRYKEYYNNTPDKRIVNNTSRQVPNTKTSVPSKARQVANTKTSVPSKARQVANTKTSVPSKARQVANTKTSVPSKARQVANTKTSVPSKARQVANTKTSVPSKARQVANTKISIPSKATQSTKAGIPSKERKRINDNTNIPTQHKQRGTLTHKNIKNARIVRNVKPTVKYKYEIDKSNKFSFSTWLSIGVVFIGAIVCLYFNASVTQKIQNINTIIQKTTKQNEINANIRVKISNSYDLVNIEKVASVKLGMSKPQEYQIINIDVPKESYIVNYSPKSEEAKPKKKFSFSTIKDFISIKKTNN